jgi:predicted transcriptional regulator
MMTEEAVPLIGTGAPMVEAIRVMDLHSLGVILVGTAENTLAGIITDGDYPPRNRQTDSRAGIGG